VILELYLAGHVLRRMLAVFAALLALFALVTFIGELGAAAADYDFMVMARFALLSLPGFATALFPMALLLGAVLGLGQLAATSELSAMRAAGRSLPRITATVLLAGAPLAAAAVMVGEVVAPQTERLAERVRAAALHRARRSCRCRTFTATSATCATTASAPPNLNLRGGANCCCRRPRR